ncbi:hypothetical protein [Burkholderia phage vB_BglM_WTB]
MNVHARLVAGVILSSPRNETEQEVSDKEQVAWYQAGWNDAAAGLPFSEEDSPNTFYALGYYDSKGQ